MKILLLIIGTALIILSYGYYNDYHSNIFQHRAVRIGYTKFYQLMDSLFNEFYDEESGQVEDMFEHHDFDENIDELVADVDESEKELACYTWSSLSDLIGVYHRRIMNVSRELRDHPNYVAEKLATPLKNMELFTRNYDIRLATAIDRLPKYLMGSKAILLSIKQSILDIGHGIQDTYPDAIEKIDEDSKEALKTIIVRFAKILRQFENVIQSQNDAHLECCCDVAKTFHDIINSTLHNSAKCVNQTGEDFEYHIKDTQMPVMHFMETTLFYLSKSMKKSKSSIDNFYQLPMQVRIHVHFRFFYSFHFFFFIKLKLRHKFQLTSANTVMNLLRLQQGSIATSIAGTYVRCQEDQLTAMYERTKELLIALKDCVEIKSFVKYSYNVF